MSDLRYPTALVKISGESLAGDQGFGIEPRVVLLNTEAFGLWAASGYMFEYEDRGVYLVDPETEEFAQMFCAEA